MKTILVTGGAGYIGSHTVLALGERGYDVVTLDNLSAGHRWAVRHGELVELDLLDREGLDRLFAARRFDAVVHFAAHIQVPESVERPLMYYVNNVGGTLNLLAAMVRHGPRYLIYSSSAAVYGIPEVIPVAEDAPLRPINPYGHTKAMVERILRDMARAGEIDYIALRYFNVAGADPGGRLGEGKEWAPHLITVAVRAAAGRRAGMTVFGTDYPTPDGTGVRDYIHVSDLAEAHVLALEHLLATGESGVFNCGYGRGYSVLEVLDAVREVTGVDFPVEYAGRRAGDPPALVADSRLIRERLGWQPRLDDLRLIVETAWRWELP
ncbi:UDP-glucose 4-epimerase GalE [Candidatus Desulforudis audaxviator]|uniref:UDP-glucose 4-epimerase n=1 Tax=Desulforudis audaxviator (strain MP104C) TaxID=477974 RepID=B1I597_DESAP|nr:UDP-glucose 4-epimerase GalE [Candidatus Desulforudis audaxviator]ACA60158.1 UDP-glucose 4-epimerase [Candidatus Desulforudis audaxviator MP104C]AZK60197.1 UDP-glucose 4-epimerase [Candidatus Desulforudis audaxviator]